MTRKGVRVFLGLIIASLLTSHALRGQSIGSEFLYAPSVGAGGLSAYGIDLSSGTLTLTPQSPFLTVCCSYLVVDPTSRFLYGSVNYGISGFSINPYTGALSPIPGSPFDMSTAFGPVAVDPTGQFIFAITNSDTVATFSVNSETGSLTLVSTTTTYIGPDASSIVVDPSGRFVYVGSLSGILAYTINTSTGGLTEVPGSPPCLVPPFECTPDRLIVHPSGRFLYAVGDGFIVPLVGFSIDPVSGALAEISGMPQINPVESVMALDPSGQFLYAGENFYPQVIVNTYQVDSVTGLLTLIPGSSASVQPSFPSDIEVDCTGKFVYAPTDSSNLLFAFAVDPQSKLLIPVPGSPYSVAAGDFTRTPIACPAPPPPDTTPPVSHVAPLPAVSSTAAFLVQWSGIDTQSGVRDYTIYVSDNGNPFVAWLTQTMATQGYYGGLLGHTYGFFSSARDGAGNQEALRLVADTTTQVPAQLAADVNGDGVVDCADVEIVKASLGKIAGQSGFDPRADVNKDGVVNVIDLAIVTQNLVPGTTCP